jgi:hypothetical protein
LAARTDDAEKADKIPSTLNWDLFTGPAEVRPFNHIYHTMELGGWWAYGTALSVIWLAHFTPGI